MADSLSIEETNRLRVALGMQPLPTNGTSNLNFKPVANTEDGEEEAGTLDTRYAAADANWKRLNDEEEARQMRKQEKERLQKERERAQRFKKLEGKGLGEGNGDELDARAWLMGAEKRRRKIEKMRQRKLAEELAQREQQGQYTESDLAGLKVGHEIRDFEDGDEQILTLKDAAVDAEESDVELENATLREKEKLADNLKLKKRKPVYDPNEAAESEDRTILAQYDEDIDGKKRKRFTLDGQGMTVEAKKEAATLGSIQADQRMKFSLDDLIKDQPISDYLDASEIKVRKPKKSKDRSRRVKIEDDDIFPPVEDEVADQMQVESAHGNKSAAQKRNYESYVDDDDLQANLATQRFAALKKRKRQRPEDLARELREESAAQMDTVEDDEGGIIIDETSQFVANLQKPEVPSKQTPKDTKRESSASASPSPGPDSDVEMPDIKREDSVGNKREGTPHAHSNMTATGLEEEAGLQGGLGNVLGMLRQRGILHGVDGSNQNESTILQGRFRHHRKQLLEQFEEEAKRKREADRARGAFDGMSNREREEYAKRENERREQFVSRQLAQLMEKEYKPSVDIKHLDEHGRMLSEKEAFKHLSHQFHGKGSGKQKTEKHLKKIEEERRKEAQSNLDTSVSSGMSNAMGVQSRKNRQAGIRLQ